MDDRLSALLYCKSKTISIYNTVIQEKNENLLIELMHAYEEVIQNTDAEFIPVSFVNSYISDTDREFVVDCLVSHMEGKYNSDDRSLKVLVARYTCKNCSSGTIKFVY